MQRFRTSTIELSKDGVICFKAEADDVYNRQDLIDILNLMEIESDGNPFLLIMLVNEHEFLMTKEARNLFQEHEKAQDLIIAEAVVISSRSTKILYNLLTKIYSPKFPFKAFNDEDAAIDWLLSKKWASL